jgi:uncharacterized protein
MRRWRLALVAALALEASAGWASGAEDRCSDSWYRSIERSVGTSDGQKHGPDVGSDEWKSTIEFKLGIRGVADLPSRDDDAWCRYVDRVVRGRRDPSRPRGPSFSCDKVEAGSIEEMVCKDEALSALDRKLSDVYEAASRRAADEHPPVLKAEQRGWVKGRDDCWKSDDRRRCVEDEYRRRIAELQARYRLVPGDGPITFACDGDPRNEIVATFFRTDPPTLIAERGDDVSLMYLQPSASGSRYQGRNETFWEHAGEATVTWGYGAPAMRCRKVQ